jgi:hypothetical protein
MKYTNQFKEYLNLTKKGLKNFDKVFEGVRNDIANSFELLSDEKKQVISDRMDICLNCPFNSEQAKTSNEYLQLTGENYETSRSELHCSLCGCTTTYKVASLSSNCGIEHWNEKNKNKQLELKWEKYEK